MSMDSHKILAVVPARGGSKGIPGKNLRKIAGISLVGRAGLITQELPWLDAAVISTDDTEIAEEGEKFGLAAPFLRPADLSGDAAKSDDAWRHAWLEAETYYETEFQISVLLEPTSPLRSATDVTKTVETLIRTGSQSAITVSETPDHYAPEKLFVLREGNVDFYVQSGRDISRRQQLPSYYNRNGICYAMWREQLMNGEPIIGKNCAAVQMADGQKHRAISFNVAVCK